MTPRYKAFKELRSKFFSGKISRYQLKKEVKKIMKGGEQLCLTGHATNVGERPLAGLRAMEKTSAPTVAHQV